MRFKLTLQLQSELMGREMPINYQYPLQAAIYRTLAQSDLEFSTWLPFDILTGKDEQEATFKMFSSLWTLAARMGWELWLPLTIELPGHDFKLAMGPKDEQRAHEIQTMLEQAELDEDGYYSEKLVDDFLPAGGREEAFRNLANYTAQNAYNFDFLKYY